MDFLTLLLLTLLLGILVIRYLFFGRPNKFERLGIPQVKPLPFVGNAASAVLRWCHFTETFDRIYKHNENAAYIGFHEFGQPVIMIRSPELIKNIAVKHFDHFVDHRNFVDFDREPLFGKNLIGLRGEKWKEMRNLLSPAFTGSKMKAMFKLMSNCAENFADYLAERSADGPNVLNTKEAFTRYTNDAIATSAFGISVDSMRNPTNDFYVMGREATNFEGGWRTLKFFIQRSFPKISRLLRLKFISEKVENFFENVVKETIEMRDRKGIVRPDMLQLMMETRGKDDGPKLTILDMTAQAFIFFFGGFDSSSTFMCFAAYEIAVNSDVQKRLQDEVDAVLEETDGKPTYEAINGMQYLDAVLNETLRLYPVAPFLDRLCVKSYELPPALPGGKPVMIDPGDNVWFPAFSIHRDPKYFVDPLKFDPERFMGSKKNVIDPFTYFPFGNGPRMCIGNRFALLESKVMFFHLLAKCHLKPSPKTQMPLKFNKATFVMMPEGGFWLQLEARSTVVRKEATTEQNGETQ